MDAEAAEGAPAAAAAGGASPFAAAPPPRSSLESATAHAAAAAAATSAMPGDASSTTSNITFALAAAGAGAAAAVDQATAHLPPRPTISRSDSLARAESLALRPLQHANIGIFGWGRNDCGQLGMPPDQGSSSCARCSSSSSSSSLPGLPGVVAAVSRLPVLEGRVVVSAAASLFNTALLTGDGELYMLGSNDSGLLGRRPKPADVSSSTGDAAAADFSWTAVRVEALEPYPLADVALGQEHALAVTQQGLLASWGSNESGQLGLGSISERPQHNPKLLKGSATSSTASKSTGAAGDAPSLRTAAARTTGGSGSPVAGGHSSSARVAFVRCAVGASNSLALSSGGRCFTFGQGIHGVLGVRGLCSSPSPVHVAGLWEVGVLQIAAGEAHCAALGANGFAYSWGRGKYGQLGHGSFEDEQEPRQVSSVSNVTSIVTGDQHTLLLVQQPQSQQQDTTYNSSSPQVYACGRGTFGATGLGSTDNVCRPRCVAALEGKGIVQLAAGRQHSVALTEAGQLYTWGAGELGQLGLGCSCSCSATTSNSRGKPSQDQEMQDVQQQQQGGTNCVHQGSWLLPQAQLSPRQLQQLPWPASCPVLFVVAGGDHSIAVVQFDSITSISSGANGAATGSTSLDRIAEDLVSNGPAESSDAAWSKGLQQQQQQQLDGATAMEVDGTAAARAAADQPQQQQQQQQRGQAVPRSGPDPELRPYGLNLLPVQLSPLLQLATAGAAEAAASRRAAATVSPDPGSTAASSSSSSSSTDAAAAAAAAGLGPQVPASATAAARDDHARAASSNARPSPVAVALAHAVLDVFSSPGLLLLLFKADSNTKNQQAQQWQQQLGLSHGLDLDRIESTYTLLLKSYAREVVGALGAASVRLLQDVHDSAARSTGASSDIVAVLFVLLQSPLNSDVHGLGGVLLGLLTALVLQLNSGSLRLLLGWLAELKPEVFGARVVRPVQALLTRLARDAVQHAGAPPGARPGLGQNRGDALLLARLLDVLHTANAQANELVPYSEFSNTAVSATVNLHEEYYTWLQSGAYKVPYGEFQAAASRAISTKHATAAAPSSSGDHSHAAGTPPQHSQHHPRQHHQQQSQHVTSSSTGVSHQWLAGGGGGGAVAVPAVLPGGSVSSLCELPFLLTTEAKSNILRDEAALQQQHVVHASAMAALLQGLPPGGIAAAAAGSTAGRGAGAGDPLSLSLSLWVRRGHEMEDALRQIRSCGPQELKKPLRVTFVSEDGRVPEEGVDQGGVSREFFQLLVAQLFNPDYGMFLYVEESRACWFNPASMESLDEFELVGIVLGLACYNGVIIDAHLPLPAYKKLMGLAPSFADLALLYPSLHSGLQQLLDYDGDVETTFCRSFEVEYEAFGTTQKAELLPGGSDMPVTSHNRGQFVDLYAAWLLSGSVADQFAAFASGFHRVCGGPALSLFRYEEVELLVEGLPHLDFKELQAGARYEAGYSASHPAITALWSVLLALPIDGKRAFLQFCTGCDRAPVAGLGALRLLVQRAGPDSEKLPTAHTCFNTLLLPEYSSRDKLQRKLMTAIQNAQGFGLQ